MTFSFVSENNEQKVMKTNGERIKLEKKFWTDCFEQFKRQGLNPKWEYISTYTSKPKIWEKIVQYHMSSNIQRFYGFSCRIGSIGNHELRFCVEMQDELKMGFRFANGINYWSDNETMQWKELGIQLEASQLGWTFKAMGWYCFRSIPVRLSFVQDDNPAARDMEYYKEDSYARMLLFDEMFSQISLLKQAVLLLYTPAKRKVWSLC